MQIKLAMIEIYSEYSSENLLKPRLSNWQRVFKI
jgi:hypothetical protein